ncbi:MAG: hypothetical protein J2P53_15990, partial [Bradyrhizobiaceae bacterium]|nr:hypothetical protein [Bradyrhizobiaceae bacterium]
MDDSTAAVTMVELSKARSPAPGARLPAGRPAAAAARPRFSLCAMVQEADRRRTPISAAGHKQEIPPWRSRLSNFVWYGRSLRTQILIVFIALSVIAASVAGGVIIFKAGVSTRIETAASMR